MHSRRRCWTLRRGDEFRRADYTGAGGAATSRSYTFTDIGNVRYPSSLTAPCSLCGSTQQQSSYDNAGNPTRQIAQDGSGTFIADAVRSREIERATFPSTYQSAAAPHHRPSAIGIEAGK